MKVLTELTGGTLCATSLSRQITPARLAWIMDVSDRTVWEWNDQNLITRFHRERTIRFSPESVLEFILRQTVRAKGGKLEVSSLPSDSEIFCGRALEQLRRLIADQVEARLEVLRFEDSRKGRAA